FVLKERPWLSVVPMKFVPKVVPAFPPALQTVDQVGTVPAPADVRTCPEVPAELFGINAPENFTLPTTSSLSVGDSVLIPTLIALAPVPPNAIALLLLMVA